VTVAPDDANAFAEKMIEMSQQPKDELEAMGKRGRAYVMANFTYPVLAKRFIDALER
jgi:glycosyltransferase involved in cell wall biosynthesis